MLSLSTPMSVIGLINLISDIPVTIMHFTKYESPLAFDERQCLQFRSSAGAVHDVGHHAIIMRYYRHVLILKVSVYDPCRVSGLQIKSVGVSMVYMSSSVASDLKHISPQHKKAES